MEIVKHFSQIIANIPFNKTLGLQLTEYNNDYVVMAFSMKEYLIGNFMQGILHGGVISSVLDMAGGAAAMLTYASKNANLPLKELAAQLSKASTVNLYVDFLRPGKGQAFSVKSFVLRSGKKISVAKMEMQNETGVLIATGSGTYLLG